MLSSLSQRVILGFIQLQLVLAILLFLPAGSIRFWEAWLYCGLFGGSVLFITWYFLKVDPDFVKRRMQIGPGAEPSKTQQIVQFMAGVLACALFLAAGLEHRLRDQICRHPSYWLLTVFWYSAWESLSAFSIPIAMPPGPSGRSEPTGGFERTLCDRSPPPICRKHPWVSGDTVRLGSLWALPFGILLCTVVVVRLLDEERFLLEHLAGYDDYCRHVRYRLIPYLW